MSFGDWIGEAENVVFLVIALVMVGAGVLVVVSQNVVHAALMLVLALAGSAALFLMLGAES
jgi:NADH:ubiquinone oxidoreductase subunit 6 (subunit J)